MNNAQTYLYLAFCLFYCLMLVKMHLNYQRNLKKIRDAYNRPGYTEKMKLDQICWVKALRRLDLLMSDPEIKGANMILGELNGGGHAWIEYERGDEIIQYEPTTDKVICIKKKGAKNETKAERVQG